MESESRTRGGSSVLRQLSSKARLLPPLLAVSLLTLAFAEAQQEAQAPPDPLAFDRFFGTYEAVDFGGQAAIIDRAIHVGTEAMGPLRRSVGRRRLHAVNRPVRILRIVHEGSNVVTEFDGDRYVAPLSGAWQRGRDPEGERIRVSYRVVGDSLRARYIGDDGEKRIAFDLSDGGRLEQTSTLLSDQLPAPIRYRLSYRRR